MNAILVFRLRQGSLSPIVQKLLQQKTGSDAAH